MPGGRVEAAMQGNEGSDEADNQGETGSSREGGGETGRREGVNKKRCDKSISRN